MQKWADWRSRRLRVEISQPELAQCRGYRFQALLDLVVLAAGSCTHLDQTRGGVELLVPPACDAFESRVRRCQTRALERAADYAQPPPCPVGSCGRATRSFRSLRAACGAACGLLLRAQQERAKPRSSRSQFARSPRFSLSSSVRRGSRSRAGHSPSQMHSHVLGLAPLAVVARPACPTARRSFDVAEEPKADNEFASSSGLSLATCLQSAERREAGVGTRQL